ncbi:MAG: hypothetical protein ABW168_15095, partial [Sedimenticola sp.]
TTPASIFVIYCFFQCRYGLPPELLEQGAANRALLSTCTPYLVQFRGVNITRLGNELVFIENSRDSNYLK